MHQDVTTISILRRTFMLLRENFVLACGAFVGLTALSAALGQFSGFGAAGMAIVSGLAIVYAQYAITKTVMESRGLDASGAGGYRATGFGAVFGVGVLFNLGVMLGMVLLIVPGIFLAIRWSAAVPALIGEDVSVTGALGESWKRTKGHGGAILGAMFVMYLPYVAGTFLTVANGIAATDPAAAVAASGMVLNITASALTSLAVIAGWHAAIAFWELRVPATSAVAEIFA